MRIAATKTDTASPVPQSPIAKQAVWPGMQLAQQASDYWMDACQRSVLFLDVIRQRGNNYFERDGEKLLPTDATEPPPSCSSMLGTLDARHKAGHDD
jgi:hypothetical protein